MRDPEGDDFPIGIDLEGSRMSGWYLQTLTPTFAQPRRPAFQRR